MHSGPAATWKWEDSDSSAECSEIIQSGSNKSLYKFFEFVKNDFNLAAVVTWNLHPSLQHLSDCQILVQNSQGRTQVFSQKEFSHKFKKFEIPSIP